MTKKFHTCLVLVSLVLVQRLEAQIPGFPAAPPAEPKQTIEDPLGRSTPQGTLKGLFEAAEADDLDRAAEYLESRLRPRDRRELARKLWVVLDRKLITTLEVASSDPGGDRGDGMAESDRVGRVDSRSGDVDVLLDRVQQTQGDPIWLFSSTTLEDIPRLYDEIELPLIERYLPERLQTVAWLSLPLYRWIGLVLIIPVFWVLTAVATRGLSALLIPLVRRVTKEQHNRSLAAGVAPLRLLVLSVLFYGASIIGVSLSARLFWSRIAMTLMVIAVSWLLLRLQDLVTELSLKRLQRLHRSGDVALVNLVNRLTKASTVIAAVLVLLYLADVDLTAALTGLGVGGIAIGFGAQKTIENLFGGIMVISDKPVNVGDLCKVGEFVGTVEDIGMRSTRIRTLDRTVVAVPNGQMAAMILENYAVRDRRRFLQTVGLGRETTAEQLRNVLAQIRDLLAAFPQVEPATARARFVRFTGASLDVEILAYVAAREESDFLAVQEDLLLGIMDIIASSGVSLAILFPAPTPAPAVDSPR